MRVDKAISEVQSFSKLCEIVEKPSIRISFWGGQFVSFKGCDGEVPIDELAVRVAKLAESNFEFTEKERLFGKRVTKDVKKLYSEFRRLINHSSWWIQFVISLRDWRHIFSYETTWSIWCGFGRRVDYFESYTQSQFQKVFGCSPDNAKRVRGFSLTKAYPIYCRNYPERWKVLKKPEYTLRSQLYWLMQEQKARILPPSKEKQTSDMWKSNDYIGSAADSSI